MQKSKLKIIPLGGINEFGKNMTVFEYEDDMFILDCGIMFPKEDMLGIDYVIPDMSYVTMHQEKLRGAVFTHGHEDHIGAVPYLLKQVSTPIYGTRLTLGLIANKLQEHGIQAVQTLINPGDKIELGCFSIEFFKVNHSIAGSVGLIINTPIGVIVHTGDYKIDYTPIDGETTDLSRLAVLGKKGILCLMTDSTNAERPGFVMSEKSVGVALARYFREAPGRIIVATFASNIHRIQQIVDEAERMGKKVCFIGRSLVNVCNTAIALGELTIPEGTMITLEHLKYYEDHEIIIITTGSQGEPMSGLVRMADDEHRQVELQEDDTIIISASAIPGNEKSISRVINQLYMKGCKVVFNPKSEVHVSGHACQEELKLILALTKPKFFIPVHGEYRNLVTAARIGGDMGIPSENIILMENGDVMEVSKTAVKLVDKIPSEPVLIDGSGIGDVGNIVLRDRRLLSLDGLMVVVVAFDKETGRLRGGPDIISRGFVYMREAEELIDEARSAVLTTIAAMDVRPFNEWAPIKIAIRNTLRDFLFEKTKRTPMILPIVMEV
ncbi:MAG: ribonuclease J [Clostridia bacterium]|nr:ribonuclease J [Clostridia bacterium]